MIKKIKWWVMAILVFTLMFGLLADIFLFVNDPESTISAVVQSYVGGSVDSLRAALAGFAVGALLVHFCEWGRKA